jgi:hypothetical protein
MSNLTLDQQRELLEQQPSWRHPRKPPGAYDAKRLRRILVRDHVLHREESPGWVSGAVVRIAHLERKSIEAATQELDAETRAANGIGMFSQALVNPHGL